MQVLFLPEWLMISLYIALWPVFQIGFSKLGNMIPDSRFNEDSFWYRTHAWEKEGKLYFRFFKIARWKNLLPDGAKIFNEGFEKGSLQSLDNEYLQSFIKETCRAELIHILQILPFWIFGLFGPFFVIWIMLGYTLIVNMPCIIAQRYNRPRLKRILAYRIYKQKD